MIETLKFIVRVESVTYTENARLYRKGCITKFEYYVILFKLWLKDFTFIALRALGYLALYLLLAVGMLALVFIFLAY